MENVFSGCASDRWFVAHLAKRSIALGAEQAAHFAGYMIVIDVEFTFSSAFAANGANARLHC